jgi:hypothetical protein
MRTITREELWNGNREQVRMLFVRPNLFRWAWDKHFADRTFVPEWVAAHPHVRLVRLRSRREVRRFLASLGR